MAEKGGDAGKEDVDEEDCERKEEERQAAEQLLEDAEAKARGKIENKAKNFNVSGQRLSVDQLSKLDGSVKKNTAFQRKLRSVTEQQRTTLTNELKNLNLSKYIQEVAISVAEAKLKLADVACAVHLCSLLHQRYDDFSSLLMDKLQKIYSSPVGKDDDKVTVVTKYRLGLRLTGELVLVGVIEEDLGLSLLQDMLSTLIKASVTEHPYLAVMVSFARHFAEDIAGIIPRKHRMVFSKFKMKPRLAQLISASKQKEFNDLLKSYYTSVSSHLVKEHRSMHKRERRNHQLLVTKGEIPEDRQAENDAAQKAYDKLLTSVSTLAEVLDEDMPDLPEYVAPQEESDISIELQFPTLGESEEADPSALWEDEETRQFYEGITDIKPFIPGILLAERKKSLSESTDEEETKQSEITEEPVDDEKLLEEMIKEAEEDMVMEDEEEEDKKTEEGGGGEKGMASELSEGAGDAAAMTADATSPGMQFDRFSVLLPTMLNRKLVDDMAVEFCMTLNTKANRRKLAWSLFAVEKNRMDLIPFYARLVATLAPCVDDVVSTLLEQLLGDLKRQIRKKDQLHIHSKLKNVRLLAELTKFGICPKPDTMKIITLLLRNFTHHHIDMACQCLEQCGRYLLRSPDSNLRARALLEILVRKKTVLHLDGRQKALVESALYYANPPSTPQITVVEEPVMQLYIKKLLYKDLNKMNTEKILKQIRKLDWRDVEVFQFTVRCLTGVWNIKYSNIHCVANLLAGLKSYQEEAVIRVVDAVLEDIRVCLEINLPKLNQRRVSCVKFVGELYNYQLVESNVVFKVLYLMLQFGSNPDGTPTPLDPFDSYFRVRLICILLEACGQYFDRGSTKRRLDTYLVYFQCYLFSKRQPLPLEVENLVRDTVELLRPHLVLFATPQEAYEAALELERKYKDKIGSGGDGDEEEDEEEETRESSYQNQEEEEEEEGDGDEGDDDDDEEEDHTGSKDNMFEEEAIFKAAPTHIKCQEDDEFVSAFEKMMSEDFHTRKTDNLKVPTMDLAVPLHLKGPTRDKTMVQESGGDTKVKFKVMTRKGNKQQLKDLMIPLESDLAVAVREVHQQAKMEAFEEVKQKTLDYERRQEEEDYQAMVAEMESNLKPASKKPSGNNSPYQGPQERHQGYHYGGGGVGDEGSRGGGYGGRGRGRGGGGGRRGGGGGQHYGSHQGGSQWNRGPHPGGGGTRGGGRGGGGGGEWRSSSHQGNRQRQQNWQ